MEYQSVFLLYSSVYAYIAHDSWTSRERERETKPSSAAIPPAHTELFACVGGGVIRQGVHCFGSVCQRKAFQTSSVSWRACLRYIEIAFFDLKPFPDDIPKSTKFPSCVLQYLSFYSQAMGINWSSGKVDSTFSFLQAIRFFTYYQYRLHIRRMPR